MVAFEDAPLIVLPFLSIVTVPVVSLMITYYSPLLGSAGNVKVSALVAIRYRPA